MNGALSAGERPGTGATRLRSLIRSARNQPGAAAAVAAPSLPPGHRVSVQRSAEAGDVEERCELCSAAIPAEHRHLLDTTSRKLLCACRACALLFDRDGAAGGRYRPIPDRCLELDDFQLSDALWNRLGIPVELAFFFFSTSADRVVAFYPGPAGATESLLELGAWEELSAANPVLQQMQADVEALLVRRGLGEGEYWLVPVDACYRLVGSIRQHWEGLSGGERVWQEIARFFDQLRREPRRVP